jgi:hypothetical protein
MKKRLCLIGLAVILTISVGCAGPSRLDMDYGTSYKLAKFNQALNPDAEKNLEPVTGFDAVSARNAIEKYHKDFEKPPEMGYTPLAIGTILGLGKK